MTSQHRSHQHPYQGDYLGTPEIREKRRISESRRNRKGRNRHRNHSQSSLKGLSLDNKHGRKRRGQSKVLLAT